MHVPRALSFPRFASRSSCTSPTPFSRLLLLSDLYRLIARRWLPLLERHSPSPLGLGDSCRYRFYDILHLDLVSVCSLLEGTSSNFHLLQATNWISSLKSVSFSSQSRCFPSIRLKPAPLRFRVSCASTIYLTKDLGQVEIVMGLEEAFGITVEEDSAQSIVTVQDAADLIEDLVMANRN
ncbi:hypothetical protein BHE74_00001437 [Ensete ventricosum]|nr:hypothetical protein BHE74_00001437 [Ensete ventricosum]